MTACSPLLAGSLRTVGLRIWLTRTSVVGTTRNLTPSMSSEEVSPITRQMVVALPQNPLHTAGSWACKALERGLQARHPAGHLQVMHAQPWTRARRPEVEGGLSGAQESSVARLSIAVAYDTVYTPGDEVLDY